jgi:DNA-binding IclR family transcriptional regulator
MGQDSRQPTVRTVERTLNILFLIAKATAPLSLGEVSESTGLDKATVLRLLATLEQFRLVQRDDKTRSYSIGSGVWQLYSYYQSELKTIAESHLRKLRDTTGESVTLVVARGLERVVLMAMEASHELRVVPSLNSVVPVYSGASGKVLMAYLERDKLDSIIEKTDLRPLNAFDVIDRDSFLTNLSQVRRDGYAISIGDVTQGAVAVAAPVFNADGTVLAVVSLRGPESRLTEDRVKKLTPLVIEAADDIARDLTGVSAEPQTADKSSDG